MGEHRTNWGSKTNLDSDYAEDLRILDENISKTNEFLEILRVQGTKTGFRYNAKKNKSLRPGISEGEEVMLGNEKIE